MNPSSTPWAGPRSARPRRTVLWAASLASMAILGLSACADFSGIASPGGVRSPASLGVPDRAPGADGTAAWAGETWWRRYGDERLNALVEQALAGQPNLQAAAARVARARAVTDAADAALLPQVNAGLDLTHQRYTRNGAVPAPLAGSVRDTGTAQLSLGWEFDFFGKYQAALAAAVGTVRAAEADRQAARVLLASSVLRGYLQLGRLEAQLDVARRTQGQREELLALVRERVRAGLDTQIELRQNEGGVPEARQQIEALQEQQALARHALAALVGDPTVADRLDGVRLPEGAGPALPAGVPADLLGRRADIVAARWRVEAALQDTTQAKAQFYPNINLMAYAGVSSIGLGRLFESGSQQWGVGPALRLPLFDAGRLRANLKIKTADAELAVQGYHTTVLEAVRDVSDQLTSATSLQRQQAEQAAAQRAAEGAWALAAERQRAGLATRLQLLAAESAVLQQRRQAIELRARALDTEVALWRSLGGGYEATVAQPNATESIAKNDPPTLASGPLDAAKAAAAR